jgi:hypothetical protein
VEKLKEAKKWKGLPLRMEKKIQSALISVFYKDGLAPLAKTLHALNITIYSTGGTQQFIEEMLFWFFVQRTRFEPRFHFFEHSLGNGDSGHACLFVP